MRPYPSGLPPVEGNEIEASLVLPFHCCPSEEEKSPLGMRTNWAWARVVRAISARVKVSLSIKILEEGKFGDKRGPLLNSRLILANRMSTIRKLYVWLLFEGGMFVIPSWVTVASTRGERNPTKRLSEPATKLAAKAEATSHGDSQNIDLPRLRCAMFSS